MTTSASVELAGSLDLARGLEHPESPAVISALQRKDGSLPSGAGVSQPLDEPGARLEPRVRREFKVPGPGRWAHADLEQVRLSEVLGRERNT